MHATLIQRMDDIGIPQDVLYGELATGTRLSGRPSLRYKDVCKRDQKAGSFNCPDLEASASNHAAWRTTSVTTTKWAKEDRDSQWRKKQLLRQLYPTHRDKVSLVADAADCGSHSGLDSHT